MNEHVYVSKCETCGGWNAVCADRPEWAKDTAKFVAKLIKDGCHPERMTHADYCKLKMCPGKKKHAAELVAK